MTSKLSSAPDAETRSLQAAGADLEVDGGDEASRGPRGEPPDAFSEGRFLDTAESRSDDPAFPPLDARLFFEREANSLAEQRPERAALMAIEAAAAVCEAGAHDEELSRALDRALELRPSSPWLLMRARRMLFERGLFARALPLAEREALNAGESSARVAVLFEASSAQLYRLNDPARALKLAEQVLRIQPHYLPALVRVASLREQLQQFDDAARAWQQLSEYLTDPAQRAQFLYLAATLHEGRLGHDEPAQANYLRALESDPRFVPALAALCELQERTEQWSALCQSLERLADVLSDEQLKARFRQEAGTLHLDRTGNLDAACKQLQLAADAALQDAAVLQRLAHAWESRGRAAETAEALVKLLDLTLDRQSRAALLTQIATLELELLRDAERAIETFRRALEEAPGYLPALQSLGTLYRQQGDFARLVEMSHPETEGSLPPESRATRYMELAELLHRQLGRPREAISAYRRALELAPGDLLAFSGIAQLLEQQRRFAELAELLGDQAQASRDRCTRAHLLLRRARVLAGPLGDPEQAIETLRRAKADDGAWGVALEQIELHKQAKRYGVLVELLQVQAARSEDAREAEGRRVEAARLLEIELDEPDKALELYREVLAANPLCAAAIHGAGRILHRRAAWTELVKLHRFELEHQPERADASSLLCRIGRILAEKLGQPEAAVQAYAEALERDPGCTPAVAALEQLSRGPDQWLKLTRVLERRASERVDALASALSLCRAAEVSAWKLGQWPRAAELYLGALAHAPKLATARHGLLRVLLHERRFAEAVELLGPLAVEAEAPEHAGLYALALARLLELRLADPGWVEAIDRAAACGGNLAAQLQQVRLRARRLQSSSELPEWLAREGQQIEDEALGVAYQIEAAHLWELAAPPQPVNASAASQAAHKRRPDDLVVLWSLQRTLLAQAKWAELAPYREKEAQLELDRDARAQHLLGAAKAYQRAGLSEQAARLCRESLSFDPYYLPALLLLAESALAGGDWQRTAELYDQIAGTCAAAENRRSYALRAATVWSGVLRDKARALASLAVALSDDPSDEEAFSFAVRLLGDEDDIDELSSIYQRAIRGCERSERRVELLRQHARLLAQIAAREGRAAVDRAIGELNALLQLRPDDVDALAELAELQSGQRRWSDAALTLAQLIDHTRDDEVRYAARVQQAELWLEHLHEPERARATLELAARERPGDLGLARLRLRVMRTVGDWAGARALLEQIAANEQLAVRLWAMLQLAEVARLGLKDGALQAHCEREVVSLAAAEPLVAAQLGELQLDAAQLRRLVDLAEQDLTDAHAETARGRRRFIAAIATDQLGEPARALQHLRPLLDEQADDPSALLLMARALEAKDEPAAALSHYRRALDLDVALVEAYRGLARTGGQEVALAAAAVVELLGQADAREQEILAGIDWDALPSGSLSAEPPQPEERFNALQRVLEALMPYLHVVYPALEGQLAPVYHPLVEPVRHLAQTIGLGPIEIKIGETGTARVGIGRPAALQVSQELATAPQGPAFRFWIGRALARALGGGAILQQLDEAELEQLFLALRERRAAVTTARELQRGLHKAVPRRVRRHVLQLLPKACDAKLRVRYQRRLERWADRLGLVLCRHPGTGLRAIARAEGVALADAWRHEEIAGLMRFVVSDEYSRLYRGVWRP